ncbi:hypothetical protein AcV5_008043 [Taiwanofungus camphoratus]|nr:hypothetical protein AcV5_008043 [Antrodia cinnamomea]KAI0930815.1 hypothetical protein AcV7_004898 [Antrodia cinnamomea]
MKTIPNYVVSEQLHQQHSILLCSGKALNVKIQTHDNVTLGAWFILSDPYYQTLRSSSSEPLPTPSSDTIKVALQSHPTVLHFHGTAGTRASTWRVPLYSSFSSRLRANVLAIDYRGFGDSSGVPSETGLALDAYAAWNWLLDQGAKAEDVLIAGHSLGTGVSSKLAVRLAKEGVKPRGVVLMSPFSSFASLVETYDIFGFPVLQPLQSFALGRKLVKRLTIDAYDTLSIIQEFNVPTLIAHATDDMDIPHTHSRTLLDRLLEPLLPPSVSLPSAPGTTVSKEVFAAFSEAQSKRKAARIALVQRVEISNFGTVEQFDNAFGRVVYVESTWGSHVKVGLQEGVQDVIAMTFKLGNFHDIVQ